MCPPHPGAPGRNVDTPFKALIFQPLFMNRTPHVAIVGATGAVGVEMIKTLEKRKFPVGKLMLLASARSAGKTMGYKGTQLPVQELTKDSFKGIEIALFSAGGSVSREF